MSRKYQIRAFETEDGHYETENVLSKKALAAKAHPGRTRQIHSAWKVEPFEEPEKPEKKRLTKKKRKISTKKPPLKKKKGRWPFQCKQKEPEVSPLDSGAFTVPDILAPASADFNNKDYIIVDGIYHTYFYVTGYGYPSTVGGGWLTPIIESGEGVNVSYSISKQAREKILPKIAHTTMINRSRMRDIGDTRQDFEEVDSAIDSGLYIKNEMNRNGEDFYYMTTLIEVYADDLDTMEQRAAWLETRCTALNMTVRRCDYRHEQGFLSALPLQSLDLDIERKGRRNALSSGVASSFPFSSFEMCDQNGIMLGINQHNRSVCMLDIFDSTKYSNAGMILMGMSGAGKTFLLQLIAARLREQGVQIYIVAPLKGHEFRPLCEAIGGTYVKLAPSSNDCINDFDIHRTNLDTDAEIGRLEVRNDSLLADKISRLHIRYSLAIPDMTPEERAYLDSAFIEIYRRKGITYDNSSIFEKDGVTKKRMPTHADMYEVLKNTPGAQRLELAESRFVTGSAWRLGQETNVDLDNKFVVIDTSEIGKDLLAAGTFTATDFCTEKCKESRVKKKTLILDELWALIGASSNPQAAEFVLECFKTYRAFGAAIIGATQDLNDFFALENGKFGRAILNNSRTKILLPLEEEEAVRVKEVMGLSDEEMLQIIRNRRGEGLLCAGHNHIAVAFQSTCLEYDMITTSRQDLERQMQANQPKQGGDI